MMVEMGQQVPEAVEVGPPLPELMRHQELVETEATVSQTPSQDHQSPMAEAEADSAQAHPVQAEPEAVELEQQTERMGQPIPEEAEGQATCSHPVLERLAVQEL
jgi:hypothetical protein